jgi:hypothetical protein
VCRIEMQRPGGVLDTGSPHTLQKQPCPSPKEAPRERSY